VESSQVGRPIHVRVRFASELAAALGSVRETVRLPAGATLADLRSQLTSLHPASLEQLHACLPVVRGSHRAWTSALEDGADVTLLTPKAGG